MIEAHTTYSFIINKLETPSFNDIINIAKNDVRKLPTAWVNDIFNSMERGTVIIDSEPQMSVYMHSYGRMHEAKLRLAFDNIDNSVLNCDDICIIDYGCGQGIATLVLIDYLRSHNIDNKKVKRIKLIDPSELCLKRAALHVSKFMPEVKLETINKELDAISEDDIIAENLCVIHLFSNILDIESISLDSLATKINNTRFLLNETICVGPHFGNNNRNNRIDSFCKLLKVESITPVEHRKSEWINDWSVMIRIGSNNNLRNISIGEKDDPTTNLKIDDFYKKIIGVTDSDEVSTLWYDNDVFVDTSYTSHLSDSLKISFGEDCVSENHVDSYGLDEMNPKTIKNCADEFLIYKIMHAYNKLTDKSIAESIMDCYHKAAKDGIYKAYNNIGVFHQQTDRLDDAIKYYLLAADNGSINAMINLSLYYYSIKDYKKAYRYTKLAADADHEVALFNLAIIYHWGLFGVHSDLELAIKYYNKVIDIIDEPSYIFNYAIFNTLKLKLTNNDISNSDALLYINKAIKPCDKLKNLKAVLMARESINGYFQIFRNLADNNVTCAYNLGLCYEEGIGCDVNTDKALDIYLKISNKAENENTNNHTALNRMGVIYNRLGEKEKASFCFEKLAEVESDNCKSMTNYAATIKETNPKKAKEIWATYSSTGRGCEECHEAYNYDKIKRECPKAQCEVAKHYLKNIPIHNNNVQNAYELAVKAATQGYPSAEFYLACIYRKGLGCEANENLAKDWYEIAARHNNSYAQCALFFFYREMEITKAIYWIALAANNGDSYAQEILARLHISNDLIKNKGEALYWFRKSATNGNPSAQYIMGEFYVSTNKNEAIKWFQLSADQGNEKAMQELSKFKKDDLY